MAFLAWFLRSVLRYRSDVVTVNLCRSFPEKTYEEIQAIHKQFYRHLASVLKETVWFGRCRGEKGRKRLRDSHIVEIANPEELNRLYAGSSYRSITKRPMWLKPSRACWPNLSPTMSW